MMSAMKRFTIVILLLLFLLSLMDDLSKQPSLVDKKPSEKPVQTEMEAGIAHIKIKPGDTVLSVTEELNDMSVLNIEQIMNDFKRLNPGTDIDSLIPYSFYSFPVYNDS